MDVTYNAEQEMKDRGPLYEKALMPCASNLVVDGRLVTGQKPRAAKATQRSFQQVNASPRPGIYRRSIVSLC
jgi:putative intracellular protease/amidase